MQVAVKAGGDEVLHTVMEIRQNPYEDLDDGGLNNFQDKSVELNDSPLDLAGPGLTKTVPGLPSQP